MVNYVWKCDEKWQRNKTNIPPAELIPCNSSFNWLNLETVNMLGPYLCNVKPDDVESSPKEKVGETTIYTINREQQYFNMLFPCFLSLTPLFSFASFSAQAVLNLTWEWAAASNPAWPESFSGSASVEKTLQNMWTSVYSCLDACVCVLLYLKSRDQNTAG